MPRRENLRVVLVSTRNPLNIGAAARAMSNFGFFDLRLVNAYDVAYHEARSAVHAGAVLERAELFANVADAVADCSLVIGTTAATGREPRHPMRRLDEAGADILAHLEDARAALLFGSEKFGLSNDDLSYCHWLARIPSRPEHASMNLGQSVAVCLYELIRTRTGIVRRQPAVPAESAEVERLATVLEETLALSGYPATLSSDASTRRLLRRLILNSEDAAILTGMLKQIRWRLTRNADATLNSK